MFGKVTAVSDKVTRCKGIFFSTFNNSRHKFHTNEQLIN